jgi:hypothetical protein
MYSKAHGRYAARTGVPCHMMQSILSTFYMHAFISLNVIILLISTFSQKGRVHVQQCVYCKSCKYACVGTQNSRAIRENKW